MIPVNRPLVNKSDIKNVVRALGDAELSGTSRSVRELEEKICVSLNTRNAIAVSSGTSAIDCVIDALDIGKEKNVVLPNLTIISAVSQMIRKEIRFRTVDVDTSTFMAENVDLVSSIDIDTVAIMPTHIYGLATLTSSMVTKLALVQPHVKVIEDAAESFGVKLKDGTFAGTNSHAGIFSFYANKNVTGGEGGAIVTNDDALANEIREIRNLGFSLTGPRFINNKIGWNARMHGLSAALISSQIDRIGSIIEMKRSIGSRYLDKLKGHPWLDFQAVDFEGMQNAYWVFAVVLNTNCPINAEKMMEILRSEDIETRRFFFPLDQQPVVQRSKLLLNDRQLPNSALLWDRGLYLPSGLGNTIAEIDLVCQKLWALVGE